MIFSPGLSITERVAKNILDDFDKGGGGSDYGEGIENIRYLVMLLGSGISDLKGVSK